jgi:hypothetical protein
MCSDERKPWHRPVTKDDLAILQELFPLFPKLVTENLVHIMTDGINTEVLTALSILVPTHDILSKNVEKEGWRKGGASVLFSAIGKNDTSKYQTEDMRVLHDTVIPFLATENMRELRAYFKKKLQIHAFFMHSCGDERFPVKKWDAVKRVGMESEQYLRTKLDWEGRLFLVDESEILKYAQISELQLDRIRRIVTYAEKISEHITA